MAGKMKPPLFLEAVDQYFDKYSMWIVIIIIHLLGLSTQRHGVHISYQSKFYR